MFIRILQIIVYYFLDNYIYVSMINIHMHTEGTLQRLDNLRQFCIRKYSYEHIFN